MDEIQSRIQQILDASTDDFMELAALMGRDPLRDYAGANLEGVDLAGKNLEGADLSECNLRGAILCGANLRKANLNKAILCRADLSSADLREANLANTDLEGANLNGALLDADVSGVVANLSLRDAVYLMELRLRGLGSHFLEEFYDAVDPVPKDIDYAHLLNHPNTTYRKGFRLLIEAFRHPSLNWVKAEKSDARWSFTDDDSFFEFQKWLSEEIIYQAEKEQEEGLEFTQDQEEIERIPHIVQLRLPPCAA